MQHQRLARLCIALALLAAGLFLVGVPIGRVLPFALALACPLMMVFMMRGMHGGHASEAPAPGIRKDGAG